MPKAEILKTYDEDYVDTVIEIAAHEFESAGGLSVRTAVHLTEIGVDLMEFFTGCIVAFEIKSTLH